MLLTWLLVLVGSIMLSYGVYQTGRIDGSKVTSSPTAASKRRSWLLLLAIGGGLVFVGLVAGSDMVTGMGGGGYGGGYEGGRGRGGRY